MDIEKGDRKERESGAVGADGLQSDDEDMDSVNGPFMVESDNDGMECDESCGGDEENSGDEIGGDNYHHDNNHNVNRRWMRSDGSRPLD